MSFLFLLFGFMVVSLALGLLLGWLIWHYENGTKDELSSLDTEISFWRNNLDHCRLELSNEQEAAVSLREETQVLKNRIQELEKALKK